MGDDPPRAVLLWHHPKARAVEGLEWRIQEWACHSSLCTFLLQVLINDLRVICCRRQIGSSEVGMGAVIAYVEAVIKL